MLPFLLALCLSTQAAPEPVRADSIPRLVRKIEFGDYGSKVIRMGDLDGDGRVDLLLIQATAPEGENKTIITCLTAVTLDGQVLWQSRQARPSEQLLRRRLSRPDPRPRRGREDGGRLHPRREKRADDPRGRTGKVVRKVTLAGGHDTILFADLSGAGRPRDLVVKNRYTAFWSTTRTST
jgi:hypothetical protein